MRFGKYEQTELRKDPIFIQVYVTWLGLIIVFMIPFIALVVLNSLIFKTIRKANSMRNNISSSESTEHNLAMMLIVVVLVFLVCNVIVAASDIQGHRILYSRTGLSLDNIHGHGLIAGK